MKGVVQGALRKELLLAFAAYSHYLFLFTGFMLYCQHILLKKKYDYHNTWNLVKTTIIVIISKSGQGKTYNKYEAGKNTS